MSDYYEDLGLDERDQFDAEEEAMDYDDYDFDAHRDQERGK